MIAPCKDCAERFPGCHGVCLKYSNFREEKEALGKKRAEQNAMHHYSSDLFGKIKHKENRKARR